MAKMRAEARALRPDPNVEQRESATPRRPVLTLAPPTAEVVEVVDQGGQTPGPTAMSTAFVLRPFATCRPASCASGRGSGRAVQRVFASASRAAAWRTIVLAFSTVMRVDE